MANAGMDPVAGYTASYETAQRDTPLATAYPLSLITPADHHFVNSIFANIPDQLRRSGAPTVLIHPSDAAPRGIAEGAPVRVFNARGAFVAAAAVSERVRRGVIASPKGRWPGLAGGANINATVDERDSDMGGGAVFHDNRVQVEAVR
jgi:anaerobic selenocysteine-containing dehydrogenase